MAHASTSTMQQKVKGDICADMCSRAASGPTGSAVLLLEAGPQMLQGLVGALLAPSPLARVFKVTSILASLAALPPPSSPAVPASTSMPALVLHWLATALDHLPAGKLHSRCLLPACGSQPAMLQVRLVQPHRQETGGLIRGQDIHIAS